MKKIYLTLAATFLSSLMVFGQTRYIDNMFSEVTVVKDVQYGVGPTTQGQPGTALKCDMYLPTGDSKTDRALVIVAHGGSFLPDYGSKEELYMKDYCEAMAKKGYAVAAINYRIGWAFNLTNTKEQNSRAILPAVWRAIQDYKTAIRFFRKTVAVDGNPYGIRPDLIIGGGFGAGGYLPMNAMILDVPEEVNIEELQKKGGIFGNTPTGEPYIDTTAYDLGGIFDTKGGHAGYSYRVDLVLNISGAIPTTKVFDKGVNPLIVSVHSEEDEATPYRSATVRAAGVFPVIDVDGSFTIHNELWGRGQNQFWNGENRDGLSQQTIDGINMYNRGLYTFRGKPYMWSNEADTYDATYDSQYRTEMDTVVSFTAFRAEKWISNYLGIDDNIIDAEVMRLSPNPTDGKVTFMNRSNGVKASKLEIFDLNGKLVVSKPLASDYEPLDLTNLANGTYTTVITHSLGQVTDKMIIQK